MTAYYKKYKTNINKIEFYIFISLLAVLTIMLTVWVLIPFTIGVNEEYLKTNNVDINSKNKENVEASKLAQLTLLSYIANALVILFFLIYIYFAARRIKVGYLFYICWILVFTTLAFIPFFKGIKILHSIQLGIGICISIFSALIVITLISSLVRYYLDRKTHYYSWVNIHKQKGR